MSFKINNLISFDIEDNFTREELVDDKDWLKYEGQVRENTCRILDLLSRHRVKATFFLLGKVADRRPEIVSKILLDGHEIASHGYIHERVGVLGKAGFKEDVRRSKETLEKMSGKPIKGFRAMAFSINAQTSWAIDYLQEQGFLYDSSILSSSFKRQVEGLKSQFSDSFIEVSPSSMFISGRDLAFGGGIFFRIAPYSLIRSLIRQENNAGKPVVIYAHAWEFNKDQPKRKVSCLQSLAQSPMTFTTPTRIERLLNDFSFTSIENALGSRP